MIFNFKRTPDKTAIIEEHQSLTYAMLDKESADLAARMGERSLLFCLSKNTAASLLMELACLNHGHVPLLLSSGLDKSLFAELVHTYKPDWLWVPEEMCVNFPEYEKQYTTRGYALLKTGWTHAYPLHAELALLLPTSGSTGSPKLVRHSKNNLLSNIEAIAQYLHINPDDRAITSLPMHYTYGLSVIHIHLWCGASVVMTEMSVTQKEFWDLFEKYAVTSLSGVPYTWEMLTRMGILRKNLGSLKYCDQAGGKLTPELQDKLVKWALDTDRRFTVMYGQTEASPRMGYLPFEKAKEKHGSMGIAIPGGRFRLLGENGEDIKEAAVVGELIFEGPNVTMGYAVEGADLAKGDEWNGILHTGDMAMRDSDGYYTIVGRKARFLKIFGNRVNLDDSERLLRRMFPDLDCACGGKDNEMQIFVVDYKEEYNLPQRLSSKLGLHPSAFRIREVLAIPRNDSGKIKYSELK